MRPLVGPDGRTNLGAVPPSKKNSGVEHPRRRVSFETRPHCEIADILCQVDDLCELFDQIDVNGDGAVDWEEFTGFAGFAAHSEYYPFRFVSRLRTTTSSLGYVYYSATNERERERERESSNPH